MRRSAALAAQPAPLDPNSFTGFYGMVIYGSCMEPAFPNNAIAKVCSDKPYKQGDVVVAWIRPELLKPGSAPALIKRVVMMPPPWVKAFPYKEHPDSEALAMVMLGQDDRPDEMIPMRCSYLLAIHKVVGLLKPDECSFDAYNELATGARR